jgi:hypothetical protein
MEYLVENTLLNPNQIVHSYQYLAAVGAGLLFLVEGVFLALMVFSYKLTPKDMGARSFGS